MPAAKNRKKPPKKRPAQPLALYLKLFLCYCFVVVLNLATSFRWEYTWPMYLLIQGVHDSYKFTGLGFSLLYVAVAISIDTLLYWWIPVKFLFISASCAVFLNKYYDEQARINAIVFENTRGGNKNISGLIQENQNIGNDDDLDTLRQNFDEVDGCESGNNPDLVYSPDYDRLVDKTGENNAETEDFSLFSAKNSENFRKSENFRNQNVEKDNKVSSSYQAANSLVTIIGTIAVVLEIIWSTQSENSNSKEEIQFVSLCRPLAAHCLGYPILQLGTQFYRMFILSIRLRNRHQVREKNEYLYKDILSSAIGKESSNSHLQHSSNGPPADQSTGLNSPYFINNSNSTQLNNFISQNSSNFQTSSSFYSSNQISPLPNSPGALGYKKSRWCSNKKSFNKSESLWNLIKQVVSNPYSPYIDCAQQHINQFYEDDLVYRFEDNSTGLILNPENNNCLNNSGMQAVGTPKTDAAATPKSGKKSRKQQQREEHVKHDKSAGKTGSKFVKNATFPQTPAKNPIKNSVSTNYNPSCRFVDVDPTTAKIIKTLQNIELTEHDKAIILAAAENSVRVTQFRPDPPLANSGVIVGNETLKVSDTENHGTDLNSGSKPENSSQNLTKNQNSSQYLNILDDENDGMESEQSTHSVPGRRKKGGKKKNANNNTQTPVYTDQINQNSNSSSFTSQNHTHNHINNTLNTKSTDNEKSSNKLSNNSLLEAYSNTIYLKVEGLKFSLDAEGKVKSNSLIVPKLSDEASALSVSSQTLENNKNNSSQQQNSQNSVVNNSSQQQNNSSNPILNNSNELENAEKLNPALILFYKLFTNILLGEDRESRLEKDVVRWKKQTSEKDKRINTLKRDLDKVSQQLSTSKAKERQHQYSVVWKWVIDDKNGKIYFF